MAVFDFECSPGLSVHERSLCVSIHVHVYVHFAQFIECLISMYVYSLYVTCGPVKRCMRFSTGLTVLPRVFLRPAYHLLCLACACIYIVYDIYTFCISQCLSSCFGHVHLLSMNMYTCTLIFTFWFLCLSLHMYIVHVHT